MKYKIILGLVFLVPLFVALIATVVIFTKEKIPSFMPPANKTLLTYSRSGGFVGYCDTLEITRNGGYKYTAPCRSDTSQAGLLNREYLDEVKSLELQLGHLTYGMSEQFADGMSESTDFMGQGNDTSLQAQEQVNDYIARVLTSIKNGTISDVLPTALPTSMQDVPEGASYYPSTTYYSSVGQIWLNIPEDFYETSVFTLFIKDRYSDSTESYKIPLKGYDMVELPLISPTKKFGCVAISASGHYGYYIFTLPEGKEVSIGPQYSQCIEWVDENRIFINEAPYNTPEHNYYIFDSSTGLKTHIGGYID